MAKKAAIKAISTFSILLSDSTKKKRGRFKAIKSAAELLISRPSILPSAPRLAENLLTSISASKPTLALKTPPAKTFLLLMLSLSATKKGRGRPKKKI